MLTPIVALSSLNDASACSKLYIAIFVFLLQQLNGEEISRIKKRRSITSSEP